MLKGRKGFTLIELLVVLAIISLLTAIAVPKFVSRIRLARMTTAEVQIGQIQNALAMLETDAGGPLYSFLDAGGTMQNPFGVVWCVNSTQIATISSADDIYYLPPSEAVTVVLSNLLKSTEEYADPSRIWRLLAPEVEDDVQFSYMEKGIPKDPWGKEYHIVVAPPPRYAFGYESYNYDYRKNWAENFRAYDAGSGISPEAASPRMSVYIWSSGQDRTSEQGVNGIGGDDINNWDTDRGWAPEYR